MIWGDPRARDSQAPLLFVFRVDMPCRHKSSSTTASRGANRAFAEIICAAELKVNHVREAVVPNNAVGRAGLPEFAGLMTANLTSVHRTAQHGFTSSRGRRTPQVLRSSLLEGVKRLRARTFTLFLWLPMVPWLL